MMRGLWWSLSSSRASSLLSRLMELRESEVRWLVEARMREFRENGRKPSRELFKELCFCILTANFSAERCMRIQQEIGDGFLTLSEGELARELRRLGHRYPESRARYIVEARWIADKLREVIESFGSQLELRDWLAKSIKGLGYKEASHFLRNIGFTDLAILDFHILNLLASYGIVEKPRSLTRRRYLEIEGKLREIARSLGLTLAELDLYLWYLETGRVLK